MGSGAGGSVEIDMNTNRLPTVGTFAQGPKISTPFLDLALGDEGCSIVSGSFTIDALQVELGDGAPGDVQSLRMTFDLYCGSPGNTDHVVGSMRYADTNADEDAGQDAGLDVPADASSDVTELGPCLGAPYAIYADGENGYSGFTGPTSIAAPEGTWSAGLSSGTFLTLTIVGQPDWQIVASSGINAIHGLRRGTYTSGGQTAGPYLQIGMTESGCREIPRGTFTIDELVSTGGDQADVTRLLMWFDLQCAGGSVTGCASYGR
jgi:hypothetical protein